MSPGAILGVAGSLALGMAAGLAVLIFSASQPSAGPPSLNIPAQHSVAAPAAAPAQPTQPSTATPAGNT
jgi:hypothetical protein